MAADRARRPVPRCPSCGSRLSGGGRRCSMCGAPLPRRLTVGGAMLESSLAVVGVIVLAGGLMWLRNHGSQFLTSSDQTTVELVARRPTDMPTFTPAPPPTYRPLPNTPDPPTATPLPAVIAHVVQSGDTLYGIAVQYNVSGDTILAANADTLTSPDRLSIGQELRIPVGQPEAIVEGEAAPDEGGAGDLQVAGGSDEAAELAAEVAAPVGEGALAVAQVVTYTVQLGDTLEAVADEHGLAADELRALNPEALADPASELQPGSDLIVRVVPVDVAPEARPPGGLGPVAGQGGESGGAVLPPEEVGQEQLPSPLALAPGHDVTVTAESPLLIWSSAGVLPPGVYYVVAMRDATAAESEPELIWVTSNATAVRVPAKLRPALGAARPLEWSVSVRRRVGRLIGPDTGVVLSGEPEWLAFTWAPGG